MHPVEDSLINYIENLAFKHFKENNADAPTSAVTANQNIITALYAEVIGVLAQTRFQSIRKRFKQEFKDNINNSQVLLNITMGLKYIRIKVQRQFEFLFKCLLGIGTYVFFSLKRLILETQFELIVSKILFKFLHDKPSC